MAQNSTNDRRTDRVNLPLIKRVLALCGHDQGTVIQGVTDNPSQSRSGLSVKTLRDAFSRPKQGHYGKTFQLLAEFLNQLLKKSEQHQHLQVTPAMLKEKYEGSLPEELRPGILKPAAGVPIPEEGSVMLLPNQKSAEQEVLRRYAGRTFSQATFVLCSPHKSSDFVQDLLDNGSRTGNESPSLGVGVKQARLIVSSERACLRLQSQRQANLIYDEVVNRVLTDRNRKRVDVIRTNLPPSLKGFQLDDELVCVGWYLWIPMFTDCDKADNRTQGLLNRLRKRFVFPDSTDRYTLNGHNMPHILAVSPSPAFKTLSEVFRLYVEAVREYQRLNGTHPDLKALKVENPLEGVTRCDPRDYFDPQTKPRPRKR